MKFVDSCLSYSIVIKNRGIDLRVSRHLRCPCSCRKIAIWARPRYRMYNKIYKLSPPDLLESFASQVLAAYRKQASQRKLEHLHSLRSALPSRFIYKANLCWPSARMACITPKNIKENKVYYHTLKRL